jgi:hypothetical protein
VGFFPRLDHLESFLALTQEKARNKFRAFSWAAYSGIYLPYHVKNFVHYAPDILPSEAPF